MTSVTTNSMALALCLLSLALWGVWANTWKMTGKWRFELYAADFLLGLAVTGLALCLTVGYFASPITFLDNLTIVRTKQVAIPIVSGGLFALGLMLLMGAVSVAGLAVAFSLSAAVAAVVWSGWAYFSTPPANPAFLSGGVLILCGSAALAAMAFRVAQKKKNEGLPLPPSPVSKRPPVPRHTAGKGIVLSMVSGVFLGCYHPLLQRATAYEVEMAPFAMVFVFLMAAFVSGLLFLVYFFNLPIEGKPVGVASYFKGTAKQHLMGILGGALWIGALSANLMAASAPAGISPGIAVSYPVALGASTLLILAGLVIWNEFSAAPDRARLFIWLSLPIFHIGVALIALAPKYAR
jgi:glucose uptake protein